MYKFYLISLMGLFLFSCTKEVEKENPLLLGDNKDSITEVVAKSVALNFVTGVNMNSGGNELEMIVNINLKMLVL